MSRKTILICTPYLDSNGAEVCLVNLLKSINIQNRFKIILVSGFKGSLQAKVPQSIKTYYLHEISQRWKWRLISKLKRKDMREDILWRIHDKEKPDFWFINTFVMMRFFNVVNKVNAPYIAYCHELEERLLKIGKTNVYNAVSSAQKIYCSSNKCSHDIQKFGKGLTKVLYPPIDFSKITPKTSERVDCWHWITVGNMDANKNPILFVEVAKEVLKEFPETTFTWIGGDLESPIGKQVLTEKSGDLEGSIRFVGWQDECYHDYINDADGYLCTSKNESFGISVLEAAYRGIPVVSTRCGGPQETLTEDLITSAKDDHHGLSELIIKVMRGEILFDSRSLHNKAMNYSMEVSQSTLYNELVAFESEL